LLPEAYQCTTCRGHSRDNIITRLKERLNGLESELHQTCDHLADVKLKSASKTEDFECQIGPIERGILEFMKEKKIKWEEYYGRIYTGGFNILNSMKKYSSSFTIQLNIFIFI
jgi:hypothetical protein